MDLLQLIKFKKRT